MLKSPFGNGPTRSSHSVFLCPSSYLSHLCKHTRTCLFDSLHLAFQFLILIETVYPSQPITTIEYMSYCNNAKLKTMVPSLIYNKVIKWYADTTSAQCFQTNLLRNSKGVLSIRLEGSDVADWCQDLRRVPVHRRAQHHNVRLRLLQEGRDDPEQCLIESLWIIAKVKTIPEWCN